jgi:hypothetical protein
MNATELLKWAEENNIDSALLVGVGAAKGVKDYGPEVIATGLLILATEVAGTSVPEEPTDG